MSIFNQFSLFNPKALDELFNEVDSRLYDSPRSASVYPYDIYNIVEDKVNKNTIIEYALAGFKKDDIKINIVGNELVVKIVNNDKQDSNIVYLHKGIAKRSLQVSWTINSTIDVEKIETSFEDGILKIVLPYKEPKTLNLM